jgi:hypothetical protein
MSSTKNTTGLKKNKKSTKPPNKNKKQPKEKSLLTNKFKALLAANLKKHNLGKDLSEKV